MALTIKILPLFFLFFLLLAAVVTAENITVDFPTFTLRNLTLLGDTHLRGGVAGLTLELGVPASSSGTLIYDHPLLFYDQDSNTTASFSTTFTFSITNANPTSFGDGLAFFLSPDNRTLGSSGGFLGLVNSSQLTKNRFVAVEFDTKLDPHFNDPNENHVGLDADSLISVATADAMSQGIDLKSGNLITTWIEYKNNLRVLDVFLSYSNTKPESPLLTVNIDLSGFLKETMFVGFSASTEGSTEIHSIHNWSFKSSGFSPARPKSHPHNVSDRSVTMVSEFPPENPTHNRRKRLGLGLSIAGPAFFCFALAVFGYMSVRKWKGTRMETELIPSDFVAGPREFSYKELHTATRGFHSGRIIGRGAFGNVYKAHFASGAVAAVKRSKRSHEGKTEFLSELSIIACLRHKNLVLLQGWCVEKGELLLVYEFMPNGSLDKMLYPETENAGGFMLLTWAHRQNIAIGLASALVYLHQECEQQIIHRDVKTGNVLLDSNFNPRLSDFGLAKLMDHDKTPVSTLTAGTMGYLAPEYLQYGRATEKTDVFSYGVVVLEVACGRRPIEREGDTQRMVNLVDWVWGLHGEGRIIEAVDKRLNGQFDREEMRKLLLLGLCCAHPDDLQRPSMRRVIQILTGEADPVAVPKMKPCLSFSCSVTVDDIVSDDEQIEAATTHV